MSKCVNLKSQGNYRILRRHYRFFTWGVLISTRDSASEIWVWKICTTCLQVTHTSKHFIVAARKGNLKLVSKFASTALFCNYTDIMCIHIIRQFSMYPTFQFHNPIWHTHNTDLAEILILAIIRFSIVLVIIDIPRRWRWI